MITFVESILVSGSPANENAKYYKKGFCMSTDTLPITGVDDLSNGSNLTEMDTGVVNYFDEDTGSWVNASSGG